MDSSNSLRQWQRHTLMDEDFAAFILTNGRPDKIYTLKTLRESGYTGKIYLIVDNLDKTRHRYQELYGDNVVIFDKNAIAKTFDTADNFNDMRAIVYARNACFDIAKDLGIKYFVQLDDDYLFFEYRFDSCQNWSKFKKIKNLDEVFSAILEFYKNTDISSIALSQGGDFIGGSQSSFAECVQLKRKCMNSFFCSTDRPFQFLGRVNEDVNTYTRSASTGSLFFTTNLVSLTQKQTQSNSGGMTEMYLDSGTYLKSFYSVLFHPSSVKISKMGDKHMRIHHKVKWKNTTPMILDECHAKNRT